MDRVVYFGTNIEAIKRLNRDYHLICVVFEKDFLDMGSINYCKDMSIEFYFVTKADGIKILLADVANIDFFVVAEFSIIFDKRLLDMPRVGAINIHLGKLPDTKGAHPFLQTIINRDEFGYMTSHIMKIEVDSGEIIFDDSFKIDYNKNYAYNKQIADSMIGDLITKSLSAFYGGMILKISKKGTTYKRLPDDKILDILNAKSLKEI
jgi:methionyl-tRNA formyltransferase